MGYEVCDWSQPKSLVALKLPTSKNLGLSTLPPKNASTVEMDFCWGFSTINYFGFFKPQIDEISRKYPEHFEGLKLLPVAAFPTANNLL